VVPSIPATLIFENKMRRLGVFAAAFALATGVFWTTMFTKPPKVEAAVQTQIDTRELTLEAHLEEGQPSDVF